MIAYIKIIIIKIKIISLNRNEEINENKFYVSKKSKIKFSSVRCSFDRSFVLMKSLLIVCIISVRLYTLYI